MHQMIYADTKVFQVSYTAIECRETVQSHDIFIILYIIIIIIDRPFHREIQERHQTCCRQPSEVQCSHSHPSAV